ncbi:MAG TPA: NADH-quinone oxidoreductase subunit L [Candidatus Nanopelagicales bacterium]|nr:NADH-quinone oxidoreductase subunit L [Candidatus Nanopelagicales bacterium]
MNPWLLPLVPAIAAALGLLVGRRPALAAAAGIAGPGGALLLAIIAFAGRPWQDPTVADLGAVDTGAVPLHAVALLDGLAGVTALAVGLVATLVQAYSVEYMRRDSRYGSYTAVVSLFTAAMMLVVVADDLLVLIVGWEVMGLSSYLLIGHHWQLAESRAAAVKAFLVTRVGDVGLIVGTLVLGSAAGTFGISGLIARVGEIDPATLTVGLLLIALGVAGKSAQFPLHTWLPDAMAGPTPISALIHAATMVAAGVYLVVRLYPLYLASPTALAVIGVSACVTMLGAALVALVEEDLKRVLAWSTVSQLAYMMGALAVGSRDAAVFHLLAHAAFKALLFLTAGVVLHSTGTVALSRLGGLRRRLPQTAVLTALGLAALAGIPPMAGFFSKESVLTAAEHAATGGGPAPTWVAWAVLCTGVLTVVVTAAYCLRLWLRAYAGAPRDLEVAARAHEPGPWMRVPMWVLAVPTVGFGLVALAGDGIATWSGGSGARLSPVLVTTAASLAAIVGGVAVVLALWWRARSADPALALTGPARPVLADGFGVDRFYHQVVVRPVRVLANLTAGADNDLIAGADGTGTRTGELGALLRRGQDGDPQRYLTVGATGFVVVAVVLLAALAVVGGGA